jgi:cbb3-type cytochrome oxidase maturation protein
MDILYMLVPLSLVLVFISVGVFLLMTKSGQFDDLEGPAHRILMDDDSVHPEPRDTADADAGRGTV